MMIEYSRKEVNQMFVKNMSFRGGLALQYSDLYAFLVVLWDIVDRRSLDICDDLLFTLNKTIEFPFIYTEKGNNDGFITNRRKLV